MNYLDSLSIISQISIYLLVGSYIVAFGMFLVMFFPVVWKLNHWSWALILPTYWIAKTIMIAASGDIFILVAGYFYLVAFALCIDYALHHLWKFIAQFL